MGEPECLSAATAILKTPCKAAFVHFQPPKNLQVSNWPDASRSSPFSLATDSPAVLLRLVSMHGYLRRALVSDWLRRSQLLKWRVVIGSRFESNCIQLLFFFPFPFLSKEDGSRRSRASDTGDCDCRLKPLGRPFFF